MIEIYEHSKVVSALSRKNADDKLLHVVTRESIKLCGLVVFLELGKNTEKIPPQTDHITRRPKLMYIEYFSFCIFF